MTGFESKSRQSLCKRASTSASSRSRSISRYLPIRTFLTSRIPKCCIASRTAAPCGSRSAAFGVTRTLTFMLQYQQSFDAEQVHFMVGTARFAVLGRIGRICFTIHFDLAAISRTAQCTVPTTQAVADSRLTSVGFLSSRSPRKTGWRNFPSRVHSANFTWQTKTGFTHVIFRIIEGVIPRTHCPPCFEGRSANGQSSRVSLFNFLWRDASDFVLKPVPTFPANRNLFFS